MNRRILLLLSMLTLLVSSCTSAESGKNSGREVQGTKPSPASEPVFWASSSPTPKSATNNKAKSNLVQTTDGNYDELVGSRSVVLLIFWAPWSAPDRVMMPMIDGVANDYAGSIKAGKVDVDENPKLAQKFRIEGIPTVVVLKHGTEQERVVGVAPRGTISALIDKHLSGNP